MELQSCVPVCGASVLSVEPVCGASVVPVCGGSVVLV